jgi:hypothetical protein
VVRKPPKDGSHRVLRLLQFFTDLVRLAVDNRQPTCRHPAFYMRLACKGADLTPSNYYLRSKSGHPPGGAVARTFPKAPHMNITDSGDSSAHLWS